METARLQGFRAHTIKWPNQLATGFALLGNTMSINVLQRLCVAIIRVLGHGEVQDPWQNGQAIAALQEDGKRDEAILPPGRRITDFFKKKETTGTTTVNTTQEDTEAQPGSTDPGSEGE